MFPPAVVVHGLDHARLALRLGRPVCLLSAQGAGHTAGVGWWRALIDAAWTESTPVGQAWDLLDCHDAPGAAMAALRHGQQRLILDPGCPSFPAVTAAAATLGAQVLDRRPQAVDLARHGAERLLAEWLAGRTITACELANDSRRGLQ